LYAKSEGPEDIIPVNASGIAVTPALEGSWSAWAEVIAAASLTQDYILHGAHQQVGLSPPGGSGTLTQWLVRYSFQLGLGAAGSEAAIQEWQHVLGNRYAASGISGGTSYDNKYTDLRGYRIPSGSRVAIRSSYYLGGGGTSVTPSTRTSLTGYFQNVPILGYEYPFYTEEQVSIPIPASMSSIMLPSLASTNTTAGTGVGTYGSWVTFLSNASTDHIVRRIFMYNETNINTHILAEIGTCPTGGTPTARSRIPFPRAATFVAFFEYPLPKPLIVRAGEDLAVRTSSNSAITVPISLEALRIP